MSSYLELDRSIEARDSSKLSDVNEISGCSNKLRILNLQAQIEEATKERNRIREALYFASRSYEESNQLVINKADAKERELRHNLVSRPLNQEFDQPLLKTNNSAASVSSIRPVPTLIGGSTRPMDSLLGPPTALQTSRFPSLLSINPPNQPIGDMKPFIETRHGDPTPPPIELNEQESVYSKMLIDPAVMLVMSRLRRAQNSYNALVTANQTDLQSFTFTQNSQNGKRIMMRTRVLEQENEELDLINRTGRTAKLESEIALRRCFVQDLKQLHSDMEFLVEEVEAETDLFGSNLLMVQQRLNFAKTTKDILLSALDDIEPNFSTNFAACRNWSSDCLLPVSISSTVTDVTSTPNDPFSIPVTKSDTADANDSPLPPSAPTIRTDSASPNNSVHVSPVSIEHASCAIRSDESIDDRLNTSSVVEISSVDSCTIREPPCKRVKSSKLLSSSPDTQVKSFSALHKSHVPMAESLERTRISDHSAGSYVGQSSSVAPFFQVSMHHRNVFDIIQDKHKNGCMDDI